MIFLDEAEAIFRARSSGSNISSWYRDILNQFLCACDGISTNDKEQPLVRAATSRPFDLDNVILLRLPLRIFTGVPDVAARASILRIHLKDEQLAANVDIPAIAASTSSFTGSDLKNLAVLAALTCVREEIACTEGASADHINKPAIPNRCCPARRALERRHFEKASGMNNSSLDIDMMRKINMFFAKIRAKAKNLVGQILTKDSEVGWLVALQCTELLDIRSGSAVIPEVSIPYRYWNRLVSITRINTGISTDCS